MFLLKCLRCGNETVIELEDRFLRFDGNKLEKVSEAVAIDVGLNGEITVFCGSCRNTLKEGFY